MDSFEEDNSPFSAPENVEVPTSGLSGLRMESGEDTNDAGLQFEDVDVSDSKNVESKAVKEPSVPSDDTVGRIESNSAAATEQRAKTYTTRVGQILMEEPNTEITIVDAGKSKEGHSRGYIAYTIKVKDITVRRRYSEFESLRKTLARLYPTLIIPPIPEKHTMSDYAAAPTKAKEDLATIEHRQRRLAVFLNRCNAMPEIRQSPVFQKFLDPNVNWADVLASPPVTDLPKSPLKGAVLSPETSSPAHQYLPIPSSTAKLKSGEDPNFSAAEVNAKDYDAIINGGLEKVNKKVIRRLSELGQDFSELGAQFNSFSLEENGQLAVAIEKTGQAVDGMYFSGESLVSNLSFSFTEPLEETAQFAGIVRNVLKYRRQKALQEEMTTESLAAKKSTLEALEKSEAEAQRIEAILGRNSTEIARQSSRTSTEIPQNTADDPLKSTPSSPDTSGKKKKFHIPGMKKLSNAISGIVESDPETTRKNNIAKTKERISELEAALSAAKTDNVDASETLKKDLERYQAEKEEDIRRMLQSYSSCLLEWARKNLESWEEAKSEIAKIQF